MSRAARTAVGGVLAGVLAFVALVSMVMSFGGGGGPGLLQGWDVETMDTAATAEVLDVDDDLDWPTVDVRWTTEDGEVVVTWVDWQWGEVPEVGDQVEVVYDAADPEYAYAADDPYVDGVLDGPAPADEAAGTDEDVAPAGSTLSRTSGWVALASLAALVLTVLATVVAVVRAPAPVPQVHVPSVYEAPLPSGAWAPPGRPHPQQPHDPYGYATQAAPAPPQQAPGPWQPPRPPDGSWPTPG